MVASVEELAMAYHQGWVDLSPDTIAALRSEDSVFHMHGVAEAAVGRESVRNLIVAFEYDMSGTIAETHFVCDGADVIVVSDGLVTRKETYLDLTALIEQIGVVPPIGAAA